MRGGARTDLVIGAVGAALCAGDALTGFTNTEATFATVTGAALIGAALGLMRTHVRVAAAVALVGLLFVATRDVVSLAPHLAIMVITFELGRRDGSWASLGALILLVAASMASSALNHTDEVAVFTFLAPAVWFAGRGLREREQTAARLAERARELDDEREAFARLSVRYERARIAAELHDIVAHAVSVMVVQASAGQRLAGVDLKRTAATFTAIADAARQAEGDMGRLVALLTDEEAIGPAPDLVLIEELVARAVGSGLDVTLSLEGEREGLPASAVELAYRVVRESLTNALRYASGAPVRVRVDGRAGDLVVEVSNGPAPASSVLADAGTGNGLRGLHERAGALGGTVDAGPITGGRGWMVSARLPRRLAAPLAPGPGVTHTDGGE